MQNTTPLDDVDFMGDAEDLAINQHASHDRYLWLCALAMFLERIAYFGVRGLFVLYATSEIIKISDNDAFHIYRHHFIAIMVFSIIGGLLGDSKFGNKKTILLGGTLSALGSFILCIPDQNAVYVGISLVCVGSGLYRTNFLVFFGKHYIDKIKLLDSSFTLIVVVVNIGAFISPLAIGWVGETKGWSYGFLIAGVLMIIALIITYFIKENSTSILEVRIKRFIPNNLHIISIVLVASLFYSLIDLGAFEYSNIVSTSTPFGLDNYSKILFENPHLLTLTIFGIFFTFYWTYFYSTQLRKLTIGFILGSIYLGILCFTQVSPPSNYFLIYILATVLYGIGYVFITPVIESTIIQYAHPKYMTVIMALTLLPGYLIGLAFGEVSVFGADNAVGFLVLGLMVMFSLGLILYSSLTRRP